MGDRKVKVANCDVTAERSKGGTLISFRDKYLSSFIRLFWINLDCDSLAPGLHNGLLVRSFLVSDIPCLYQDECLKSILRYKYVLYIVNIFYENVHTMQYKG